MKIAVNTRLLIKDKLEGIGWVAYETLKRITREHKEHQFYFIFDRKFDDEFIFSENIEPIVTPPQARHPLLYYIWFEHSIPRILKRTRADLFLSPDSFLSLSTRTKSMAIFHDLNFEHYPEDIPFFHRKFYRHYFPRYAKKADRLVTVSKFTKRDIINQYNIPEEKIEVVYNGANEAFIPLPEEIKNATRNKYTRGRPYYLFVGALHPRKNIARLFKAFDYFKNSHHSDIQLLIVGKKQWWTKEIKKAYEEMDNRDDVIFTGRLEAEELHRVIASALAMTYVSYFEGFGIPIVEAFYCDTPVITSSTTSMPEVAGNAALLVDPFSVKAIAEAMGYLASDEGLREDLVIKGRERRKLFNWDNSANQLWNSIIKTLS